MEQKTGGQVKEVTKKEMLVCALVPCESCTLESSIPNCNRIQKAIRKLIENSDRKPKVTKEQYEKVAKRIGKLEGGWEMPIEPDYEEADAILDILGLEVEG
jgi:hypothetical protein